MKVWYGLKDDYRAMMRRGEWILSDQVRKANEAGNIVFFCICIALLFAFFAALLAAVYS